MKKLKKCLFLLAIPAFTLMGVFGFFNNPITTSADTDFNITASAVSKDGVTLSLDAISWKDLLYFEITLENSPLINELFSYEFSSTWTEDLVSNKESFETDHKQTGIIIQGETSNFTNVPESIRFYIDETQTLTSSNHYLASDVFDAEYLEHGAWGSYYFSFSYKTSGNEINTISTDDIFKVNALPITNEMKADGLTIKRSIIRSEYLLENAYLFEVSNPDFKYVDKSLIVWKITGESADGTNYVLSDTQKPDNKTKSLGGNKEYNGNTFKFDFEITGTWTVSYVIYQDQAAKTTGTAFDEVVIDEPFSTVKTYKTWTIYFIIGGVALGVIAILVIIIVVAKKKEKIW